MSAREAPLALLPDAADRYARQRRLSAALWAFTAVVLAVLLVTVSQMASRIATLEAQLHPTARTATQTVAVTTPQDPAPAPAVLRRGRH